MLYDLMGAAEPGHVFRFDVMVRTLQEGLPERTVTIDTVRGAANRLHGRLLREQSRALQSVTGVGYRIAEAASHQVIAHGRRRRADTQLRRAVDVLRHVRWDEMDPNARKAHEGTLILVAGLYENQRALGRRQKRVEDVLQQIMQGVSGDVPRVA